jgi:hypothetical protein
LLSVPARESASGCFQETRKLPARFARLASVTLIVIAPTSTAAAPTTKTLSAPAAALGAIGLGLRFVDLQSPAAQFRAIECGNGFVRFGGIGHFHESKTAGAAGFAISHNADFFDCSVSLENGSQFGLGCAVGQISYVKILHGSSSFSISAKNSGFRLRPG